MNSDLHMCKQSYAKVLNGVCTQTRNNMKRSGGSINSLSYRLVYYKISQFIKYLNNTMAIKNKQPNQLMECVNKI